MIGEIVVDDRIDKIQFECDLDRCLGACCTMPGSFGAPLLDSEIDIMKGLVPIVQQYLPEDHIDVIDHIGFYQGESGKYTTTCVDHRSCVFVFFDKNIARCALERAFLDHQSQWRKPLSCHLFPLRFDRYGTQRLRFEYIEECESGLRKGKINDTELTKYVRESLIRAFGEQWYDELISNDR